MILTPDITAIDVTLNDVLLDASIRADVLRPPLTLVWRRKGCDDARLQALDVDALDTVFRVSFPDGFVASQARGYYTGGLCVGDEVLASLDFVVGAPFKATCIAHHEGQQPFVPDAYETPTEQCGVLCSPIRKPAYRVVKDDESGVDIQVT